jgi:eukaryotic-like serine/threonine-protein kinase
VAEEIVIDEYTLLNHIATGSSTQVWEVIDRTSGDRRFAMKVMLPEAFADSEQRHVLKHEAKLLQRFDHPNLVRMHKLVMNKKRAYMLMDYFRAPNLKTQMQAEIVGVRARITKLIEQLGAALGHLHEKGFVHRDIKPDNILFNRASELRLIDFSLTARAASAFTKMLIGKGRVIQGTRSYISPESILKAPSTPQSDIYSVGVTLYEIVAGEAPFRGSSPDDLLRKHLTSKAPPPSDYNPNVTPEMDRFILRMLAKKPKDRHKDMQELLVEFRNIKPWKEDAIEHDRRLKDAEAERYKMTLDKAGRLDSRADHEKQQMYKQNPELAEAAKAKAAQAQKKAAAPNPKIVVEKTTPAKSPAAQPVAVAARPQAPPVAPPPPRPAIPPPPPPMPAGYPGAFPAPNYGYPGYAPPGYPMAGYPPSGYPPAGYPPGSYAPQPYPQMPMGAYAPPQYAPPPNAMGQPSAPSQPPGMPAAPYGAAPYGSPLGLPSGVGQPGVPRQPTVPAGVTQRPIAPAPVTGIPSQQDLASEFLGQPQPSAADPRLAGAPKAVPKAPAKAPAAPPPGNVPANDLPLMDQLPPID